MTLDERLEAITMNLELATRDIQDLKTIAATALDSIKALERIAAIHEHRLSDLEK
jgi:hypothetical protein